MLAGLLQLAGEALSDPACTWLWRSLRHAEVVGLDSAGVLRQVIGARSLIDARNVEAGAPKLMEIELAEPDLFLKYDD